MRWLCGALRPEELDPLEPLAERLAESFVPGVGRGAELCLQPLRAKQGYPGGSCFDRPTFPDDPDVEIEQPWRVGQPGYDLPLHWNRVLIDLLVKALAQPNDVIGLIMPWRFLVVSAVEPELHAIKKMEPLAVEDLSAESFFIRAEEHAGSKDALESLDEAAVVNAVLGKLQELKQLSGSFEVNGTALLLHRQRGNPDGNQPVLAERQTKTRMGDYLQKKLSVLTTMN